MRSMSLPSRLTSAPDVLCVTIGRSYSAARAGHIKTDKDQSDWQDGQRLYVDHQNRRFSYVHPADLPRNEGTGPISNSRPGALARVANKS